MGVGKKISVAMHSHGAPVTVPVSSTRWPAAQRSTLEVTRFEPKPDAEQELELAVFLQSLQPTEEPECWEEVEPVFQNETESEVDTLWAENDELDQYILAVWSSKNLGLLYTFCLSALFSALTDLCIFQLSHCGTSHFSSA